MPNDYLTTDTELTSVANAIRTKGGTSASLVYPAGFVSAINAIPTGGGGTDVSDTTAVAGDVLAGKYFHIADGTKVQGTIVSKTSSDVTTSSNVVTIPAGHYASQVQKTVGTAQAAQTITPTTSDQTIASGKYLTGTQTIKGDANLVAGNIKKDVQIFGVTGSYEGGGGGSIKRIAGTGSTVVYPTGWNTADFGTSVPGDSDVIDANNPKFLVMHITLNNVVRSFVPIYCNTSKIYAVGSVTTSGTDSTVNITITMTAGYINSIQFPSTISGKTVGAWEIISNLPVREEPSGGTFYIDVDGDPIECSFGADTNIWIEWIQTEYNEIGMDSDGDYLTVEGRYLFYDGNGEEPVMANDEITDGTTYYLLLL